MGQPAETKRLDKTNYDVEKWIQFGLLNSKCRRGAKNTCHTLEANDVSNALNTKSYIFFEIGYDPRQQINGCRLFKFLTTTSVTE